MIIAECHDYAISGSAVLVLSMWANSPRLAESPAEVDAARLTLRHNIKLLIDAAYSGDELSIGERLRIRRDIPSPAGSAIARRTASSRPAAPTPFCAAHRYSTLRATSRPPFTREY
jgi:hypothetical protein